ncbi:nitrate reductase associated protein [Oscillatoria sp. FACHB-1406]|uniref:nitrate reductase associated protein n=1 Tax=Oscillatoria sp. FACHB-1406 TaxID=2692846 RepID=UPI0016866217|nr:nitrate reductase associated protein [Oscillatoria sp. FACHB-1406]MBD2577307.1 nitrate reductase associated protein [Oscillatoria sp. FACHB-1406]
MNHFFKFETDFVESLRCIPMQVRLKLDTCGVKLKLAHWNQLSTEERQSLVEKPCTTEAESKAYREDLQQLVIEHTGQPAGELAIDPHPPWLDTATIPEEVQLKAAEFGKQLTLQDWNNLTPEQRFALIKLSRPSHENKNFLPALQEFKLL